MRWPDRLSWVEKRIRNLSLFIGAAFLVLLGGLWNVQIIHGAKYQRLARNFRVRRVYLPARRGKIYDRNGAFLADNRVSWDVDVVTEDVENIPVLSKELASILDLDAARVSRKIREGGDLPFMPVTIARDIGLERATMLEERRMDMAGVTVRMYPRRRYIDGEAIFPVIGYIGGLDEKERDEMAGYDYIAHEVEGKAGVERSLDEFLRGTAGGEQIQVDSRGYRDSVLGRVDPVPGSNVYLTIDGRLQQALWEALGDKQGCAVAMDPRNGDVLAMVSKPSADPNLFVSPVSASDVRELFSDRAHPMVNRTVSGAYPPGSTFKLIVALAALRNGVVNSTTTYDCDGVFYLGRARFRCWRKGGHGAVALVDAIMGSCNVYFYNVGVQTGREKIVEMAAELGLGAKTGIDLPGEVSGFLPTEEWVAGSLREGWFPGDTVSLSIGQGYLTATPIQLAAAISAIANGGSLYRPRLIRHVIAPDGNIIESFDPEVRREIGIDPSHRLLVKEGMYAVVNSRRGTGRKAKVEGFDLAGKTGTIQITVDGEETNHGWFVGFAPAGDPEIVVVVLVENAASGGYEAAPVAAAFLQEYLKLRGPEKESADSERVEGQSDAAG